MDNTKDKLKNKSIKLAQNSPFFKADIICNACSAVNSIHWEKKEINIDDKKGSYKDLTFNFCEDCGNVTNVDLS